MSYPPPLSNQHIALQKSVRAHEGCKLKAYQDSEGVWSIGIGRNMQQMTITEQQANEWLAEDLESAVRELDRAVEGWRAHSPARQNVLIELMFQLGAPNLLGFVKMLSAMRSQDYAGAALELLASRYASQVPKRANTLARRLEMDLFE